MRSIFFMKETFRSTIRPVSRPLTVALDDINKFPSDDTVSLLTWVQLVIPHEGIRTSRIASGVYVGIASNVERRGAVEVVGGVVVDVRELLELLLARLCTHGVARIHLPVH